MDTVFGEMFNVRERNLHPIEASGIDVASPLGIHNVACR